MSKLIGAYTPPFGEEEDTNPPKNKDEDSVDVVNHPPHYNVGNIECIDYIEQQLGNEGFKSYLEGNVLKYMHRWRYKGKSGQDLEKAQWYLNKLINLI